MDFSAKRFRDARMDAAAHFPLLLPNGIYLTGPESNGRVAPYSLTPEHSILRSVRRAHDVYFRVLL